MAVVSMVYGIVLVLIGVIGFAATGAASMTALIPAIPGVIVGTCGILAQTKPAWRKHVMHVAVLVALLTVVAMIDPLRRGPDAVVLTAVLLTMAASVVYILMAVRSFIAARQARQDEPSP